MREREEGRTNRRLAPFLQDAQSAGRYLAAVVLGFLPRAFYPRLESAFPIHLASVPSAAAELLSGFALGIPAFLVYAWRVANENTDLMLAAAAKQQQTHAGPTVTGAMSVAPSAFTIFVFVFFTPAGLVSLYLAGGGFVRMVAALVDDPFGDPILTGVHRVLVHVRSRRAFARAAAARLSLEGAEVPDRILTGAESGIRGAEVVVMSARRKPGWEESVLVVTNRGWFRIGRVFEEYHDGGLRTLYPLVRSPESEVMRRAVTYDLPDDAPADPAPPEVDSNEEP